MHKLSITHYIPHILIAIMLVLVGYLVYENYTQSKEIQMLQEDRNLFLNQSNARQNQLNSANSTIETLEAELENLKDDLEDLADDYRDEKDRNEDFEDQIRGLAGTLGDLDKLSKTDKELLAKYSKVYFLNENYIPERLTRIDQDWIAEGKDDEYFHASAYKHLRDLMRAAEDDDIDLKIVSAYRSFDEQTDLKGQYKQVYGEGANTFSADQGYSEHQLGTTVDFSTPANSNALTEGFDQTEAFEWLEENAHGYGFILSYPPDNTFYVYEPWHWRFVGTDLARDLERKNDTFYDLDQREIDKYLLNLFD